MSKNITLAIDGMGGDNAPKAVIDGLNRVRRKLSNVNFHVFGDKNKLTPLITRHPRLYDIVKIIHTPDEIAPDAKVSEALRKGKNSSMAKAINHVKNKKAAGVVSAGNTAALVGISLINLRPIEGVKRPALTTMLPTKKGFSVMLDFGATAECDEQNLFEFAIMGSLYHKIILNEKEKPTLGILNIGSEQTKGKEYLRKTYDIFTEKASDLPFDFKGFIEGNDITQGTTDIIVTDGFSGNIALKSIEGTAKLFKHIIKDGIKNSLLAQIGLFTFFPLFRNLKKRIDPRNYSGAILSGVNGIVVKSHGSSDYIAFSNAVMYAYNLAQNNYNNIITKEIKKFSI